ncbi:MAG: hypothetical protein HY774_16190 [Acidobacteria bacterium]|nr:hypothetical protein [Acidobacteriota bacterium]
MNQLIIKIEGKPIKCEICHQSDVFDVATQVCLRCRDLASVPSVSKPVQAFSGEDRVSFFRRLNAQFEDSVQQEKAIEQEALKSSDFVFLLSLLNLGVFIGGSAFFAVLFRSSEGFNWTVYWMLVLLIIEVIIGVLIKHRHPFLAKGFIFNGVLFIVSIPVGIGLMHFYLWLAWRNL